MARFVRCKLCSYVQSEREFDSFAKCRMCSNNHGTVINISGVLFMPGLEWSRRKKRGRNEDDND